MSQKASSASKSRTAARQKRGTTVSPRLIAQAKRQLATAARQRRRAAKQQSTAAAINVTKRPRDFVSLFTQITEPRRERRVTHSLIAIMFMSVAAVLAGAEGPEDIADFAKQHTDWIKRFVPLPNGVPSHDTIGRVLSLINPAEFQQAFLDWLGTWTEMPAATTATTPDNSSAASESPEFVAIDGKTCSNSHSTKQPHPLHLVSAWSGRLGLTLGQVAVREKSNEITAIPKLLELLELQNAIVSIDAMGCQREIAAKIISRGGHYVLAVKANHPTLNSLITDFFLQRGERKDWEACDCRKHVTHEKSRGRDETRTYYLAPLPPELQYLTNDWVGLRSLGMVQTVTIHNGKTSTDTRYYISSRPAVVQEFARAVRGHWSIESMHWVLDVVFGEDDSRLREGAVAANFSFLRKFVLSLLKRDTSEGSIKRKQKRAGWNVAFLERVLFSRGF